MEEQRMRKRKKRWKLAAGQRRLPENQWSEKRGQRQEEARWSNAHTHLLATMVSPTSECPSPSSSPPTPRSPLPLSVGPGHDSYPLSPSPSPSPPFSPSSAGWSSPESAPLLSQTSPTELHTEPSAFSLDKLWEGRPRSPRPWCLKDGLRRLLLRCCCFCSPSAFQADQEEEYFSCSSSAVELNSQAVHSHASSGKKGQ